MRSLITRRFGVSSIVLGALAVPLGVSAPTASALSVGSPVRIAGAQTTYRTISDDFAFLISGPDSPQALTQTNLSTGASVSFLRPGFLGGTTISTRNGQYVLYSTFDPLLATDTDNDLDTYRYRIGDGALTLVSIGAARGSAPVAANLDGSVTVLRDVVFGTLRRVDLTNESVIDLAALVPGEIPPGLMGMDAAVSANGRYTVFTAGNFLCEACIHAYVHDAVTGDVTLVDRGAGGMPADGSVVSIAISADGRHVLFGSTAGDLIAPSSPKPALWAKDLDTGVVQRIARLG